ncbi:MAG TPA: GNAT family N-acetyltransferase [Rhizomicrobium sp.]
MSGGIVIARCADAGRRADILTLVHAAFGALTPPSGALNETLDDVAARFKAGPVLIAQDGGELVGSLYCALKESGLYLTRMAVKPSRQKQGIGRALLTAAEAEARRLGARKLTLRVRLSLPANRAYFERAGFRVTGQGQEPGRPRYEVMERPLE